MRTHHGQSPLKGHGLQCKEQCVVLVTRQVFHRPRRMLFIRVAAVITIFVHMEKLKPLSEVLRPDDRNSAFVRLDTLQPLTMAEHYAEIGAVVLDPQVPEDIRSYFATIQNVYLYSWFAYDLYTVAEFLCFTAVEMALRKRLPYNGIGKDKRTLQNLMDQAVSRKLIRDKAFSNVRIMRQNLARDIRFRRAISGRFPRSAMPKSNYAAVLQGSIPWLRNHHAHPRMHTIMFPGAALSQLQVASELINSLFA
ncbi:MAG: hypothetical protein JWQ87_2285 [Candidatus Sulfotelmatobacter sp.]|nr:hypothetical protein [Candidatus Sulfotelmatobacter sp.]